MTDKDHDTAHLALMKYAAENHHSVLATATPEVVKVEVDALIAAGPMDVAANGAAAEAKRKRDGQQVSTAQNDLGLLQCLLHYSVSRGAKTKNKNKAKTTMKLVARVLGNPTCRQMTPSAQHKLIAHLRAKGRTDRTALDRNKLIWTAMHYARDMELLVPTAIPPRLGPKKWDPPAKLRKRNAKLKDDQVVAMFIAAADPASPEYVWRWLICQAGTVCRPSAPLLVRNGNYDAEVRNLTLLEADAVQEENKRKATVRCCPTLNGWMQQWAKEQHDPTFPQYRKSGDGPFGYDPLFILDENGDPITDLSFHKDLAKRAGVVLPKGTDAYIWRHTLITWLARHGVPEEQRKFMSGHRIAEGSHGEYIHFEPDYLKEAVEAIEELFAMVAPKIPRGFRSLVPPAMVASLVDQPLPMGVGQSHIHMLRRASHLVENRGYSVAEFSQILNGIKETSIAVEIACGDL